MKQPTARRPRHPSRLHRLAGAIAVLADSMTLHTTGLTRPVPVEIQAREGTGARRAASDASKPADRDLYRTR
jgi:hypothetical protein